MSYSLDSLKAVQKGIILAVVREDTTRLGYSSHSSDIHQTSFSDSVVEQRFLSQHLPMLFINSPLALAKRFHEP